MEKTPKYEFGKPDQNDFYDVDVFNNNMEKVETAMTEFDDTGTVAEIKSFPEMLTKLVTGNKLAVTLRNLKAGLQFVLHAGSIVNNCVTDNPNLPLSAAQGKTLMDLYNVLNTKGKIYYASGSKKAEYKVEIGIVELTVPAGKYLVLAANSVTTPKPGQMSCGLGASSGTMIGINTTRTESASGGGVVNFAYLDTDNISTIITSGYGYNDESYMYRSILVAIRL